MGNITLGLNISEIKKYESQHYTIKINNKSQNITPYENSKVSIKSKNNISQNMRDNSSNFNNDILKKKNNDIFRKETFNLKDFNDHIDLNIFDYFCYNQDSKKYKLFKSGYSFYRKKMDIVHVFNIIFIFEKFLLNSNYKNKLALYEEID